MDYKYIECLIERYFDCQTTQEEEQILHNFFRQKDIPAHLKSYSDLFLAYDAEADIQLPADFDQQLMARIQETEQKSKLNRQSSMRIASIHRSLRPFYKAVASIALIITVGVSSSQYWNRQEADPVEYNYSNYHDTYSDPEVAYEQLNDALKDLSDAFRVNGIATSDSVAATDTLANKAWAPTQTN